MVSIKLYTNPIHREITIQCKKNSILLFSVLLLILGCKENPLTIENFSSYFPLQIGNEWSFEFRYSGHWLDTMVTISYYSFIQ